jgi:hypothetical protein
MLRLIRRAGLLFGVYASLLLAVGVAGFLGGAVGIWASILWGAAVLAGLALCAFIGQGKTGRAECYGDADGVSNTAIAPPP